MPISSLAYVGLGVADPAAWARYAGDVLGLESCGTDAEGITRLRMDARAWRIALHTSPRNDLIYAGFDVVAAKEMAALEAELQRLGVPVRRMTATETARRKVQAGILLQDPDGLDLEVVQGPEDAGGGFASPHGVAFRTGAQGMGHIVISTSNADRSVAFYATLGFAVSDYIDVNLGPGMAARVVFMHCNERHHSLALLPLPVPARLNHLMLEAQSVDNVIEAYYRAQQAGVPIMRHLGRHTNDHMLSFYSQTPGGFDVELGCEGRPVGPGWKVDVYDAISLWGHHS